MSSLCGRASLETGLHARPGAGARYRLYLLSRGRRVPARSGSQRSGSGAASAASLTTHPGPRFPREVKIHTESR